MPQTANPANRHTPNLNAIRPAFCEICPTTLHYTLHYSTHYTTLRYTTLHYIHYILPYTTYYTTHYTTHYTTLPYSTHTTLHYEVQNIVPDFSVFYISVNRALILLCEPRFSEKPLRNGSEQSERKARAVSSAAAGAQKSKDAPPAGEPNVARAPNFNTTCWAPGPKSPEKITLLHQFVTSQ